MGHRITLLCLVAGLLICSSALAKNVTGRVSWVYDGDTIKVDGIGIIRLIGIDTPEKNDSPRDKYYLRQARIKSDDLRKIAEQALQFNKQKLKNRIVILEFDRERIDTYGRTLAYVLLPDGQMLNLLLVQKGLAAVYRRFDFQHKQEFLQAEKSARSQHLGLWQK